MMLESIIMSVFRFCVYDSKDVFESCVVGRRVHRERQGGRCEGDSAAIHPRDAHRERGIQCLRGSHGPLTFWRRKKASSIAELVFVSVQSVSFALAFVRLHAR